MKHDLKRPCPNCPFRTDCPEGWLSATRARGIVESIAGRQESFPCHETVEHDDDGVPGFPGDGQKQCAGAEILLAKHGASTQQARIADRFGKAIELDMGAPVFDTYDEFIEHHRSERDPNEEEVEFESCSVVNATCLAPAGYAVGGGVMHADPPDPEVMGYCFDCGQPVCDNCSTIVDGERICYYCRED